MTAIADGLLPCSQCHERKPPEDFHRHARNTNRGGRASECKACHKLQNRRYHANNTAKYQAWRKALRARKGVEMNAETAAWHAAHPQEVKVHKARWRAKNRERANAMSEAWRRAHPERDKEKGARYRARLAAAPVIEQIDREALYARDQWICQLCHEKVSAQDASLDHIIPLSKGGEHTARNLVLVHRRCNSGKCNRAVTQQMRLLG